ncbi:sialate O-acetylesterase [Labilibacter sediminis]|nr:sialate O-acetylesterase [Labilibacter sediminis]
MPGLIKPDFIIKLECMKRIKSFPKEVLIMLLWKRIFRDLQTIEMKNKVITIIAIVIFPSFIFSQTVRKDTIKVFYLGGQSNMDGFGYNSELPDSLKEGFKDVWIFHGNPAPDRMRKGGKGIWEPLKPGHGTGFKSDGITNQLSERFGVELSFASLLRQLYPNDKIAIIKYSRGGTSIDSVSARRFGCWDVDYNRGNGLNQYDHFLTTIKNAFSYNDINKNGIDDCLIPQGIIWMQGESDADFTEEVAMRYGYNLKRLMSLLRASLLNNDLPIVLGKISDSGDDIDGRVWDYGELVQYAQEKFSQEGTNVSIVRSTSNYGYSDKWHYNSEGYIHLGEQFAQEIYKLIENNTK